MKHMLSLTFILSARLVRMYDSASAKTLLAHQWTKQHGKKAQLILMRRSPRHCSSSAHLSSTPPVAVSFLPGAQLLRSLQVLVRSLRWLLIDGGVAEGLWWLPIIILGPYRRNRLRASATISALAWEAVIGNATGIDVFVSDTLDDPPCVGMYRIA
jgi:hypothetical protein